MVVNLRHMSIRRRVQRILARLFQALQPPPDNTGTLRALTEVLRNLKPDEDTLRKRWAQEDAAERMEAQQFSGAGPWLTDGTRTALLANESAKRLSEATKRDIDVRETNPTLSQGAFGDIELALQNVEWRREINLSWLEFSRWGIQQIILISRLYYIKNPIIRRLIDIASIYPFARGVEISSSDPDADAELKDFFERNSKTLGQVGLVDAERRKYYDGNLFWALFSDKTASGKTLIRSIDATEIMDIITDPNDTDQPWYYRRVWVSRNFDVKTGQIATEHQECYHPALNFFPKEQPATINSQPVKWDVPVYHRKCGAVAKWNFGCPMIYPAIDWAKASRRFLEACATVKQALATIAMTVSTKGGQQAIEGLKQQLATTVGPSAALWDTNPTPVNASTFVSGPGTEVQFMNQSGKGGDPEEVRQFKLMATMCVGVPETFLSDVSTGNLATATTLDRPTELVFLERQEAWREDLVVIAKYVLGVSAAAPGSKFKEALDRRKVNVKDVVIMERARKLGPDGRMQYVWTKADTSTAVAEAAAAAKGNATTDIEVTVTFPAIREGDMGIRVKAIAEAMTLDNKGGQIVGIDERAGVLMLLKEVGYEDAEELIEEMYPIDEYEPDRTKEPIAAPIHKAVPNPGGEPQAPAGNPTSAPGQVDPQPLGDGNTMREAVKTRRKLEALFELIGNGHH
jgi:hypothetical protein